MAPPNRQEHKWRSTTIDSILRNEKYKGDALLQKKFTVDFLSKKCKRNEGELPQYYIEDGHEAIIPKATFDYVQAEIRRRIELYGIHYSSAHPLATKIYCNDCGCYFGLHGSHGDEYKSFFWYCLKRYNKYYKCKNIRIKASVMECFCKKAFSRLLKNSTIPTQYLLTKIKLLDISSNRKTAIKNFFNNDMRYEIEIPDDVLSITIEKIVPFSRDNIEFSFMNGQIVSVSWDNLNDNK